MRFNGVIPFLNVKAGVDQTEFELDWLVKHIQRNYKERGRLFNLISSVWLLRLMWQMFAEWIKYSFSFYSQFITFSVTSRELSIINLEITTVHLYLIFLLSSRRELHFVHTSIHSFNSPWPKPWWWWSGSLELYHKIDKNVPITSQIHTIPPR
jgi:hypothetical protein